MNDSPVRADAHTAAGAAFTELILETFRLNGRLLAAGDRLTRDLGLTSARWQVLGAIAAGPLPAAQIARNMGLQRQSVQRLVDALAADGLVEFATNPNHRRAKLVRLSAEGHSALQAVSRRQVEWSNRTAEGLGAGDLEAAVGVLRRLRARLEDEERRR